MGVNVLCLAILAVFYFHGQQARCACSRQEAASSESVHLPSAAPADRKSRKQLGRFFCVAALVLTVYLADLVQNRFPISGELMKDIQITAHRGGSRHAPENTLAALIAAEEELADYAEIDVQMTADGVVVLGHDGDLRRVAGVNRTIASMEWEELSRLDVGGWFSPEYAGERIPALKEVLEFCSGKLRLNIEIKHAGPGSTLPEKVAELVRDYGYEEQCVITSASLEDLVRVKRAAPELKTGYIIPAAYGDYYSMDAVDFISIRQSFVNKALVEKLHRQGKEVHVWTVNQRRDMERLRLLGVDNLITDDPVLAREIICQEEAAESIMEYLRMVIR